MRPMPYRGDAVSPPLARSSVIEVQAGHLQPCVGVGDGVARLSPELTHHPHTNHRHGTAANANANTAAASACRRVEEEFDPGDRRGSYHGASDAH